MALWKSMGPGHKLAAQDRQAAKERGSNSPARLALWLILLASALALPRQVTILAERLPVIRLWSDRDAQYRLQLGAIPYDLLQVADKLVPPVATVLLVTPGQDVRHLDYTTFHRALYFLAPRPVWWLAPIPPDGTWESRWWISAPVTAESITAVAAAKGAGYLLATDSSLPLPPAQRLGSAAGGAVYRLENCAGAGCDSRPATGMSGGEQLDIIWPVQLALALLVIFSLGYLVLAVMARLGFRAQGAEAAALAWILGAAVTSLAMLWLSWLAVPLSSQIPILTTIAILWLLWLWFHRPRQTLLSLRNLILHPRRLPSAHSLIPHPPPTSPLPGARHTAFIFLFLACQVLFVAIMALGQPLDIWDSWVNWGMKGRLIFLEGGVTPAVYADASRAVTLLDYPLFVPLLEAWLYGWLGMPDDRLVGVLSLLFFLALPAIVYAAVRRRRAGQHTALLASVAVASVPQLVLLAGSVFTDFPLAVLVTVAAVYLVAWLEGGPPGALAMAAIAAGLMPWMKREGLILLVAFCLALLVIAFWKKEKRSSGRALRPALWMAIAAFCLAAALVAGPWWWFVARHGLANDAFMPLSFVTLWANSSRLPVITMLVAINLLQTQWAFIWPIAALIALRQLFAPENRRGHGRIAILPLAALLYVALMTLAYHFSDYVPYQQHVLSSNFRLIAHVAPLPVLWLAYQAGSEKFNWRLTSKTLANHWPFLLVFGLGLLIRLPVLAIDFGASSDLVAFGRWARAIQGQGLAAIYSATELRLNYPPLLIYLFGAAAAIEAQLPAAWRAGDQALIALIKIPALVADLATAALLMIALPGHSPRHKLLVGGLYLLNPAIWYVSAYWGQADAVYTFFLVASILALSQNAIGGAWAAYALALLTKQQSLALLPLLVVVTWRRSALSGLARGLLCASLIGASLTAPWWLTGHAADLWRGVTTLPNAPRVDVSGYNLWFLLRLGRVHLFSSEIRPFGLPLTYGQMGLLLFVAAAGLIAALRWRGGGRTLPLAAAALVMAFFLLMTEIHERYLFPALAFLLWAASGHRAQLAGKTNWLAYGLISLTFLYNLLTVAPFHPALGGNLVADVALGTGSPQSVQFRLALALLAVTVNLVVFGLIIIRLAAKGEGDRQAWGLPAQINGDSHAAHQRAGKGRR